MFGVSDVLRLGSSRRKGASAAGASVLLMVLITTVPGCQPYPVDRQAPNLYLSPWELELITRAVEQEQSPWKEAYQDLMVRADEALGRLPSPVSGVYPRDKSEPRSHYRAITRDSDTALDLALAYALTGEGRYAARARVFIMEWTHQLVPELDHYQQGIELSITLPSFFHAADLIWNSGHLTVEDRLAIQRWARRFAYSMIDAEGSCCGPLHNINNWEWSMEIAAGVVSGDEYLVRRAISKFRSVAASRYTDEGLLESEGERTFEYAMFALSALTMIAEAARHQGVDLYGYQANGTTLERVVRQHFQWYVDRNYPGKAANYEEITAVGYAGLAELYNSRRPSPVYDQAIAAHGGRPVYDPWILGPATLTHGGRRLANSEPPLKDSASVR